VRVSPGSPAGARLASERAVARLLLRQRRLPRRFLKLATIDSVVFHRSPLQKARETPDNRQKYKLPQGTCKHGGGFER